MSNRNHTWHLLDAAREAVRAYESTGRMLDAALAYASFALPVFPVSPGSKRPIPQREPDCEYPEGRPRTGGVYKATCNPNIIRRWWSEHPHALIGLPMGKRTRVWALDVDSSEDHADGIAEWDRIIAQHTRIKTKWGKHPRHDSKLPVLRFAVPPFTTREHRTATGGLHLIFNWREELPIRCGKGALPSGIEVKGQGGYIVVPPSRRKGRTYTVHRDIDPADPPEWLTDLILQRRSHTSNSGLNKKPTPKPARQFSAGSRSTAELDELAEAMSFVPNDDLDWGEWTAVALALFAASDGQGFDLFDEWSQKSGKYDPHTTRERWQEIMGSPPDRTGAGKLFKLARENGWQRDVTHRGRKRIHLLKRPRKRAPATPRLEAIYVRVAHEIERTSEQVRRWWSDG
jgi:Bifunctional DNA primase/polymerase, N-terminal/Primase C terminal 2 (PriCT-2)